MTIRSRLTTCDRGTAKIRITEAGAGFDVGDVGWCAWVKLDGRTTLGRFRRTPEDAAADAHAAAAVTMLVAFVRLVAFDAIDAARLS